MTNSTPNVKSFSQKILSWIDTHPRTGWYVAIWAFLVSLNTLVDIASRVGLT